MGSEIRPIDPPTSDHLLEARLKRESAGKGWAPTTPPRGRDTERLTPFSLLKNSTRGAASPFLDAGAPPSPIRTASTGGNSPLRQPIAASATPEIPTLHTTSDARTETAGLLVIQQGMRCHLRFLHGLPKRLEPYLTLGQWEQLRSRVDAIAMSTKWNPFRNYLLFASVGVLILFLTSILFEDGMGHELSMNAELFSLLVVIIMVFLQLAWSKRREERNRTNLLQSMQALCKEYTEDLKQYGISVTFTYKDYHGDNDEDQIVADLVFNFDGETTGYKAPVLEGDCAV